MHAYHAYLHGILKSFNHVHVITERCKILDYTWWVWHGPSSTYNIHGPFMGALRLLAFGILQLHVLWS
jgi:hypothetical protein